METSEEMYKLGYELGVLRAQTASLKTSLALINEYVANWRTADEDGRKRILTAVEHMAVMQVYPDASLAVIHAREDAAKGVQS